MFLRVDLVFSYWILFWYIIYIFRYTQYNPKFAIGLGIFENFIMLLMMVYFNTSFNSIIRFVIINIFLKIIPYYTLRNTVIYLKDILASIRLFIIYIVWLFINGQNVIALQNKVFVSLVKDKNETPMMWLFNKLENYFKYYKPLII
jgi:hypothetical protein